MNIISYSIVKAANASFDKDMRYLAVFCYDNFIKAVNKLTPKKIGKRRFYDTGQSKLEVRLTFNLGVITKHKYFKEVKIFIDLIDGGFADRFDNIRGFYDYRSKTISILCYTDMDRFSKDGEYKNISEFNKKRLLTLCKKFVSSMDFENAFLHEITHYIDVVRSDGSVSKSKRRSPDDRTSYVESPSEFNALYQSGVAGIETNKHVLKILKVKESMSDNFERFFDYVKNRFFSNYGKEFYSGKNRKRLRKRLYNVYKNIKYTI
jgi:hypothetical protein